MLPWFGLEKFSHFQSVCLKLLHGLKKYLDFLKQQQQRNEVHHASEKPVRSMTDNWSMKTIQPCPKKNSNYLDVEKTLSGMEDYQPLWLFDFEPADRFDRRLWYENFSLPFSAKVYTHRVGNFIGNYTFVWKISSKKSERSDEDDLQVLSEIRENLPVYSTRAMRKLFIDRYARETGMKAAVLRDMYQFVKGDSAAAESSKQREVDERFAKFIIETDDPELVWDLRTNNGRPINEKLNPFWEALDQFINRESVVHERRHGNHTYMPIAISLEDLRDQVQKTLPPDTPVPSISWLRLNLWPSNPYGSSAENYTGRFKMKFAIQQRLVRASHPDNQYAFYLFSMMKKMSVKFREDSTFICVDDKAVVPIGEPGKPVSTVRAHHRSLVPQNVTLAALDHDFHVHGAVPSVLFRVEIPENSSDSFYEGTIHVTIKDKLFQPSSAVRHTTEITSILRSVISMDGISLTTPILFLYSDGGPDHRSTYWSVQLAYILLFISLDLDLLVTARTAPSHSYYNPAERCMSILNLALQNVSLERCAMLDDQEFRVKSRSTMKARRDIALRQGDMKDALIQSVEPVISNVKARFGRLKYQEEGVRIHDAAKDEEIDAICSLIDLFRDVDKPEPVTLNDVKNRNSLKKFPMLQQFVERHTRSRQYSFQVCFETLLKKVV